MTIHKFHKIENNTVTDSKLVDIKNCGIGSPLIYNEADGIAYMNNLVAGTWVGDVEDVPAYTGHAAINGTFENNYFKLPSPHASFVWNDSTKTWDNPVPNLKMILLSLLMIQTTNHLILTPRHFY